MARTGLGYLGSLKKLYSALKGELKGIREPAKWRTRLIADREKLESQAPELLARDIEIVGHLAAIARIIHIAEPRWVPEEAKAKRTKRRFSPLPHGGISRAAYDVLRTANRPMTTREIVAELARVHGVDISTSFMKERHRDNVGSGLRRLSELGLVAHDDGKPTRWWVVPVEELPEDAFF